MRYDVIFDGVIINMADHTPVPPEHVAEWIDVLTVELMKTGALSPALAGSSEDATIEIRVVVEAPTPVDAMVLGNSQIRAAAHAGGLMTAGWELDWVAVKALGAKVPDDPRDLVSAHEPA